MSRSRLFAPLVACLLAAAPPVTPALTATGPAGSPVVAPAAASSPDAALAAMVETERAFAALALEKGMRAAFIEYIAEEGVGFDNGPIPLRQAMRDRPVGPESFRLIWEPRYGDIATSGEVGYLTGPYRVEAQGKDGAPVTSHGCFFSVWRRQADGSFRNIVDMGVRLPEAPRFEAGFHRATRADRDAGAAAAGKAGEAGSGAAAAETSLRAAEQAFNDAARAGTLNAALAAVLDPSVRVHREGVAPAVGVVQARDLLGGAGRLAEAQTRFAGVAASGDFGWAYGRYAHAAIGAGADAEGAAPEHGSYARVWARDRDGTWRIAVDVASPDREPR